MDLLTMNRIDVLTLFIALYGAVMSTILAVRRERREDGRLRVNVWVGRLTSTRDGVRPFCQFQVVNIGRRPARFGGLVLQDGRGKYVDQILGPCEDGDYITLEPGEACEHPQGRHYENMTKLLQARRVVAIHTLGRTRLVWWRFQKMQREVRRVQREAAAHPFGEASELTVEQM